MSRLAILLALWASLAWAVDPSLDEGSIPITEQPEIVVPGENGEKVEPEVTIVRRGKDIVEEYRVNNRLYMVKIKPTIGPAYYLVDTDGDGNMDVRRSEAEKQIQVPQWVLFSW